jgi:hypothetical protein
MKHLVPLYAVTLFISAFLLFSVQPMVGKYLLPLMGGGPSVWNTAMLFFQLLLLGGYAYAHGMARFLKPRTQHYIHVALLLLAALSLPLTLPAGADPTGHNPLLWQLSTMVLMAAAPFFILSSTAPLLQQWFAKTNHAKAENPYFLYVASNIGSMLALLSYPIVIEPMLHLYDQSIVWSYGYGLLAVLLIICGLVSKFSAQRDGEILIHEEDEAITWKRRLTWLLLAFVPSSLMLGVTTFITTDVTTVPLFWVIPLALYLLSFIIAFSEKPALSLPLTRIVQAISALFLLFLMILNSMMLLWNVAVIHLLFFFFTALMCHQELAALKPKARHLTEFYLIMSLGGALGGIFNSLLAPLIFELPYEYMIVIILSLFCRYVSDSNQPSLQLSWAWIRDFRTYGWKILLIAVLGIIAAISNVKLVDLFCALAIPFLCFSYFNRRWLFGVLYLAAVLLNPLVSWQNLTKTIAIARNYYGVILVQDKDGVRLMTHGVTNHGGQALDPDKKFFAYYGPGSGLADIYQTSYMKGDRYQNIGLLGLGTGSTACFYNAENRHFDYFEIDPNVIAIAENPEYFTYLSDCGANYTIHEGDGRLLMASMADQKYDFILVDVFTSDNIPMHIITRNAVEIYQKKLKPDGILLFHTSNRFFNLAPELGAIAEAMGGKAMKKINIPKDDTSSGLRTSLFNYPSSYVVIAGDQVMEELKHIDPAWTDIEADSRRPWTDDYANILRALIIR